MDVRRGAAQLAVLVIGFVAVGCSTADETCGAPDAVCAGSEACIGGQCTADDRVLWVVGRLSVPPRDGEVLDGFDLDQHVSVAEDGEGCGFNDFVAPDGTPGIDNEFAALVPQIDPLLPIIGPPNVQYLLDRSIAEGDILLGVVIAATDDPNRVDAFIHELEPTSVDPLLVDEDNSLSAHQEFTLVQPPQLAALGVDVSDGVLALGPFETQISLLGAVGVPMKNTLLRMDLGNEAGDGITGGSADTTPIVEYQPVIEPLIHRDLPFPGVEGCHGTSMAFYFHGVPGVIAE
jgi:hypothetical protein